MKKWTVMLIPRNCGGTRTLTLCEWHLWVACALISSMAFCSAFFYQRQQSLAHYASVLRQANRMLEIEAASRPSAPAPAPTHRGDELRQLESQLRAEYEAALSAITTELDELYQMERQARQITGIGGAPVRDNSGRSSTGGGKGGGPSRVGPIEYVGRPYVPGPRTLIYGASYASADEIKEEIRLRRAGLTTLVASVRQEAEQARIARMPSLWPVSGNLGRISSEFGYRRDPFTRRVRHHDGMDISARHGTPVRAAARGVVRKVEYMGDLGNTVVVDHGNGLSTAYAHLSAMSVRPGETVDRGAMIGRVGSTGRSTGAHLHYEVHLNGRPVNPRKYTPK